MVLAHRININGQPGAMSTPLTRRTNGSRARVYFAGKDMLQKKVLYFLNHVNDFCSNGCGMDIGVKNGKVVGVRGRTTDRVNKGRLGPKGLNGYVILSITGTSTILTLTRWITVGHPDRLKHPLIRKNGKLERATWNEAMSLIVEKANEVRSRLTNHGIGFYTTGQLFIEEYYVLAMIGKAGLNTLQM